MVDTTQEATQPTVDYSQWYFKFNSTTGELIPGATHEKVDNSTTQDPAGVQFPIFDTSTNTWKTDETKLATFQQQQEQAAAQVDPDKQKAAQILQMVVAQKAEIAALQAQINAKAVTVSQTASQSTSTSVSGGATNA